MFTKLRTYPYQNSIYIVWTYEKSDLSATPEYYVERSDDNQSTWTTLNTSSIDGYIYQDSSLSPADLLDNIYYRIRVTYDSADIVSDPVSVFSIWDKQSWGLASNILSQERTRLNHPLLGTAGYLIKRRTAGKQCTVCTDPVTEAVTNPSCDTCYGTGIVGGFYPSLRIVTEYNKIEDYRDRWRDLSGSFSTDARVIRLPAFIDWIEGDVWEDISSAKRFIMTSQYKIISEIQGKPLIYTGIIDKVEPDSVFYEFDSSNELL